MRDRARTGISDILFAPKPYFNTVIKTYEITNKDFHRIARLDFYNSDTGARNLINAIRFLKMISGKLKISYQTKSHAMLLYRKALKKGLIRGRSIEGMVCASLYFACRQFKLPIPFKEIVDESHVKENSIKICVKILIKELNLKLIPLGPEAFIPKYINKLKLSPEIEKKVFDTLTQLKTFMIGKNPKVVCAGLIYLICKKNNVTCSQVKISKIIGVTEVSLRYTWKKIENLISRMA